MTLLFSLTWPIILTQSWTCIETNTILEITVFIWKIGSGHFQRHLKIDHCLYKITSAVNKIGAGSKFQTSVSAYIKATNLLLIGHVKITFVSSTVFNVSCIDCTLSNYVSVLKLGMSVMVIYQPALFYCLWILKDFGFQELEEVSRALSRRSKSSGLDYCWYNSFNYFNS